MPQLDPKPTSRPMPRLAPVTTATLFVSCISTTAVRALQGTRQR